MLEMPRWTVRLLIEAPETAKDAQKLSDKLDKAIPEANVCPQRNDDGSWSVAVATTRIADAASSAILLTAHDVRECLTGLPRKGIIEATAKLAGLS